MASGTFSKVGLLFLGALSLNSCGTRREEKPLPPPYPEIEAERSQGQVPVQGFARIGNQCPYGSFIPPQQVPLELWNCPMNLPTVELNEPLQPLILQADCKKKTLDVRGEDRQKATTWEVMPDGNFYFTIDAGVAKLKKDGKGKSNCTVPLVAEMWGRLDCKDREKVTIRVQTVWWMGKTFAQWSGTPEAHPSGVPSVTPLPHGGTSPNTGFPVPSTSSTPSPFPSSFPGFPVPSPSLFPEPFPSSFPLTPRIYAPVDAASECEIPQGCYFHNMSQIDQCS